MLKIPQPPHDSCLSYERFISRDNFRSSFFSRVFFPLLPPPLFSCFSNLLPCLTFPPLYTSSPPYNLFLTMTHLIHISFNVFCCCLFFLLHINSFTHSSTLRLSLQQHLVDDTKTNEIQDCIPILPVRYRSSSSTRLYESQKKKRGVKNCCFLSIYTQSVLLS